jgi:hypothetical protein
MIKALKLAAATAALFAISTTAQAVSFLGGTLDTYSIPTTGWYDFTVAGVRAARGSPLVQSAVAAR